MSATRDDIQKMIQMHEYKKNNSFNILDDSDTNFRKVEYRTEEHDKLRMVNRIINMIYYAFIILLFMLLYTNDTLYLKDRYILYIFLLILPYLYPWIWILGNKLKNLIMPDISYTGPKNAFIDKSVDPLPLNI
jgi:hypothetical protein